MKCISVQMLIFHLEVNFVHPKIARSALCRCPILTIVIRLLEIVTKVTNLTVKIEFYFFSSARLYASSVRHETPKNSFKFSWLVPFELSFLPQQRYKFNKFTIMIQLSAKCLTPQ